MHTDHKYFQQMLPDLVAGKLEAQQRADLESHLASCDECSRHRSGLDTISAALKGFRPSDPPAHYFNNVLPGIRLRLERKGIPEEHSLLRRFIAPVGAMVIVIGVLAQTAVNNNNGLRSMLGTLKTDELADVVVDQAEHQSLYLIPSTESLAAALPDEAIDRELAATILLDDGDATYASVTDLSDNDVKLILERLGERKIL